MARKPRNAFRHETIAKQLVAEIREGIQQRFAGVQRLEASDVADAILYIVTRPAHVAINELLMRPTAQAD